MAKKPQVAAAADIIDRAYVRERRLALGYSYAAAAEAAGWGAAHKMRWHHVESGRNRDPRASTLQGVARALRCGVERLLSSK